MTAPDLEKRKASPLNNHVARISPSSGSPASLASFSRWSGGVLELWAQLDSTGSCASLSKKLLTLHCLAHYRWWSKKRAGDKQHGGILLGCSQSSKVHGFLRKRPFLIKFGWAHAPHISSSSNSSTVSFFFLTLAKCWYVCNNTHAKSKYLFTKIWT